MKEENIRAEESIKRNDLIIITNYAKRIENSIAKRGTSDDMEDVFSILQDFRKEISTDIIHKIYSNQLKVICDTANAFHTAKLHFIPSNFKTDGEVFSWVISQLESALKETKKLAAEYNIYLEDGNYERL